MNRSVVVLIDPHQSTIPAAALPVLRSASVVYAASDVDAERLGIEPPVEIDKLLADPVVLVASSRVEPRAAALLSEGARCIEVTRPVGTRLLDAVSIMDRLRSPGGCPWDAAQTHESLRQNLVEETYELLDAIETHDRVALREELGDVLLQVLFHARLAAEDQETPFNIDDVAEELVTKLIGRHPYIFAPTELTEEYQQPTVEHHRQRWEEVKQQEKQRMSIVDGVAFGQPAIALAAKLGQRSGRAGIPLDLFPAGTDAAAELFRTAAAAKRAGDDPEGELRVLAKAFADDVRSAERAARAADVDPSTLEADGWRRFWPGQG